MHWARGGLQSLLCRTERIIWCGLWGSVVVLEKLWISRNKYLYNKVSSYEYRSRNKFAAWPFCTPILLLIIFGSMLPRTFSSSKKGIYIKYQHSGIVFNLTGIYFKGKFFTSADRVRLYNAESDLLSMQKLDSTYNILRLKYNLKW